MLQKIIDLDKAIIKFINHDMSVGFFEPILVWMRNSLIWIPIYIFIVSFIIFNFRKRSYRILLYLVAAVAISDFVSAKLFKPFFGRLRPCHESLDFDLIDRVGCGGLYSFTSNHAANHFAISVFLSLFFNSQFPKLKYILILWAALISFSQVYVGVHYLSDVIMGALLGSLISFLVYKIYIKQNGSSFDKIDMA
jgi:undecaprenyl-diphosphatase